MHRPLLLKGATQCAATVMLLSRCARGQSLGEAPGRKWTLQLIVLRGFMHTDCSCTQGMQGCLRPGLRGVDAYGSDLNLNCGWPALTRPETQRAPMNESRHASGSALCQPVCRLHHACLLESSHRSSERCAQNPEFPGGEPANGRSLAELHGDGKLLGFSV